MGLVWSVIKIRCFTNPCKKCVTPQGRQGFWSVRVNNFYSTCEQCPEKWRQQTATTVSDKFELYISPSSLLCLSTFSGVTASNPQMFVHFGDIWPLHLFKHQSTSITGLLVKMSKYSSRWWILSLSSQEKAMYAKYCRFLVCFLHRNGMLKQNSSSAIQYFRDTYTQI